MVDSVVPRRALILAVPAAAFVSRYGFVRSAFAQDSEALSKGLSTSQKVAIALAQDIRGAKFSIEAEQAQDWRLRDFGGRLALATAAVGFGQGALVERVPEERRYLSDALVGREVPLIPNPVEIVSLPTEPQRRGACPSKMEVCWDILLDSLDLLEEKELFKEAIRAVEGMDDRLSDIETAVDESDWDRAVDGLFNLLEFLFERAIVARLVENLGEKVAFKFLKAVSLRLIPFVGYGYAIAALGLSVRRHWASLTC